MDNTIYWTMKNGQKIDIDTMDVNHLRNTLKMIVRNKAKVQVNVPVAPKFKLHGDIAQDHVAQMEDQEYYDSMMGDFEF